MKMIKIHFFVMAIGLILGAFILPDIQKQTEIVFSELFPRVEKKKHPKKPSDVPMKKWVPNNAAIIPKNVKNKRA